MSTAVVTLKHDAHGTYNVKPLHFAETVEAYNGWSLTGLIGLIDELIGEPGLYNDLTWVEALILISYLSGGQAV